MAIPDQLRDTQFNCNNTVPSVSPPPGINLRLSCSEHIYSIELNAHGGNTPYIWTTTAGKLTTSGPDNENALIELDAYVGPTFDCDGEDIPSEVAYRRVGIVYTPNEGLNSCDVLDNGGIAYNCNEQEINAATVGGGDPVPPDLAQVQINPGEFHHCDPLPEYPAAPATICGDQPGGDAAGFLQVNPGAGLVIDDRTPTMITDGCFPCKLLEDTDLVVTLIDAAEIAVPIVIHIDA